MVSEKSSESSLGLNLVQKYLIRIPIIIMRAIKANSASGLLLLSSWLVVVGCGNEGGAAHDEVLALKKEVIITIIVVEQYWVVEVELKALFLERERQSIVVGEYFGRDAFIYIGLAWIR